MRNKKNEEEQLWCGLNFNEYVFSSKLSIKHFDSILCESFKKTGSLEMFLLREVYRSCFDGLGIHRKEFQEFQEALEKGEDGND